MTRIVTTDSPKRIQRASFLLLVMVVMLASCKPEPQPSPAPSTEPSPTNTAEPTPSKTATAVSFPPQNTPTSSPIPQPSSTPTDASPPPVEPTATTPAAAWANCIGAAAGGGNPPQNTQDLHIQINIPLMQTYEPVLAFFNQHARECDGLGMLGRFAERVPWQEMVGDLPNGILFYSLPSLALAQETADIWTDDVDWFAYEMTFAERTPSEEHSVPAQTSQAALQFARDHDLVYFVTPGRPVTKRHAAELAQYADVYGLQAHGQLRDSPQTFIQLVKDTSQEIRAVNPDILLYVAVNTDEPEDDPQATYEIITQLLGHIDGVFIVTSSEADSMEKLETLVSLLREE
ncbi:MAG: hypothetical protein GY796_26965 [Chloroflexi bacterium]|nr:hypothetical protein [Chloroflexota bacterium]